MQGQSPNPAPTRRECAGVPNATTSGMAQGQPKKPASQLAKSPKRRQTKLGKGCMPSQKAANIDRQAKVFKAKNTAIRKDQIKQSDITKHINKKNELELASRAAAFRGTGTGNLSQFTVLKSLVAEGKKLNTTGGMKKSEVKSGSKR